MKTPPSEQRINKLIEGWFSDGTYVGMLINEMTAEQTDSDRASALFDMVFDDPNGDFFADPIPEVDEDGFLLSVPKRPMLAKVVIAAVLMIFGWVAWSQIASQAKPVRADLNAMAGAEHDHQHDHHNHAHRPPPNMVIPSEEANFSGDAVSLRAPSPGDWLYEFPEQGQSYHQYLVQARDNSKPRFALYMIAVGAFQDEDTQVFNATAEYLSAYYNVPVRILPGVSLPIDAFDPERGQYDARHVLDTLHTKLPKDGFGLLAMTNSDLYIPSLRFVFGLGSHKNEVAVFSTRRLGNDHRLIGETGTVLKRSLTVAVHEIGHVIAMRHCTAFQCIMNGNSSIEEADAHPLHLCPVCIRKAEHGFGFDRHHRYERLLDFYTDYNFDEEAAFVRRRLNPPKLNHISNL